MHNLQIQVGELHRLKIGGGGTWHAVSPRSLETHYSLRITHYLQKRQVILLWGSDAVLLCKHTWWTVHKTSVTHGIVTCSSLNQCCTRTIHTCMKESALGLGLGEVYDVTCISPNNEVNCCCVWPACDAETQFRCGSGECKPLCTRCDGRRDCADSSDEFNCSTLYTLHSSVPMSSLEDVDCCADMSVKPSRMKNDLKRLWNTCKIHLCTLLWIIIYNKFVQPATRNYCTLCANCSYGSLSMAAYRS